MYIPNHTAIIDEATRAELFIAVLEALQSKQVVCNGHVVLAIEEMVKLLAGLIAEGKTCIREVDR